jgi:predicted DCC family thiol-disulfide oxidoreductase YuxK
MWLAGGFSLLRRLTAVNSDQRRVDGISAQRAFERDGTILRRGRSLAEPWRNGTWRRLLPVRNRVCGPAGEACMQPSPVIRN